MVFASNKKNNEKLSFNIINHGCNTMYKGALMANYWKLYKNYRKFQNFQNTWNNNCFAYLKQ